MSALPDWYEDFLEETLAKGQPQAPAVDVFVEGQHCRWCGHHVHGFVCHSCRVCESSWTARDDSWRPRDDYSLRYMVSKFMDRHGVDGYVATIAAGYVPTVEAQVRGYRIRRILTGTHIR